MRRAASLLVLLVFLVAAGLSVLAARLAVTTLERFSVEAVRDELVLLGHEWVTVIGDGLQVILEGEAPTEALRFQVMSIAGGIVDASRVIDNMHAAPTETIAPPDFAIEILRNDSGVSLIGLIPESTDRPRLSSEIEAIAGGRPVSDLMQSAEYPVPEAWAPTLDYALQALNLLPRSKISVAAGRITVLAIADSAAQRNRLEAELRRALPEGVALDLTITAPRPVISPFTVRFRIEGETARFDACSADTEETREVILTAARAAGAGGDLACTIGLGAPSRAWGEAVARAIAALTEIGGGTVTFSDADVTLVAVPGTDRALFDRVVGELDNALPEVFALGAEFPEVVDAADAGPVEFTAALSPEGAIVLRGRVADDMMNDTVANVAAARFGADLVTMGTRVQEGNLPAGWSVRVLAGIEALGALAHGDLVVQPDLVQVRGTAGSTTAADDIARLLIERLGAEARFDIDVTYDEKLDPAAALPTPEECLAEVTALTAERKITFDPGSANLSASAVSLVDDIAEVLVRCPDIPLEIAGYTDSQGRDQMNLDLSQARAEAVLSSLRTRRVTVDSYRAQGYGEVDPIADNETEEGREANRRIEFRLVAAEAPPAEPAADGSP